MAVHPRNSLTFVLSVLLLLGSVAPSFGQEPEDEPAETGESSEAPEDDDEKPDEGKDKKNGIKPYDKVITDEAESDDGVFTVHRIDDKLFYEIPTTELGPEFLWVSRVAKTRVGQGYGGQKMGSSVVRWERHRDRVFLREVSYDIVADPSLPIAQAVDAANNDTILMAFDIQALGENDSPVIEVTPLFTSEVTELSAKSRLQARGFDKKRSYVERAMSFPRNVEVRAVHTYTRPPENNPQRGGPPPPRRFRQPMPPGSATLELAYSMVKLPDEPMRPRLYDDRVGYFSVRQTDYGVHGVDEHKASERRYITRWRLERKDPSAEISDPVQPIVYWIDPATPAKWVPYMKQGVEDWQAAFEAAGFSNAIVARDAPTAEQDPEWSPEDSRYSVIRWLPSDIENASGPHVHDPRTGEILESDIQFYHNVQKLVRDWYFVQAAPLDPRAQKLPMPDELMGELLRYVAAHEVGHTLGFQHNMKASSTYPFEKVRDPEWLAEMGHTPTLMDYSRFNYVAQPEDGIRVEDLIPGIGPYDKWATGWGYRPIPEASSSDAERPILDRWAREQDEKPWLRFSTAGSRGADPGELTEAVGDADAVAATELGLKNLERVVDILIEATSTEGRNWDELEELYGRVIGQWTREMNHVAAIVGGYASRQRHAGQEGVRYEPIDADRQAAAVRFLNQRAFTTSDFLVRPEILRRIEAAGVIDRLSSAQRSVLDFLLRPDRFDRLVEQSALASQKSYDPVTFVDDLTSGIWSELEDRKVEIDAFRRATQRTYLEVVDARLNGSSPVQDDQRAFLRGELNQLRSELASAAPKASDDATRFHLADAREQIGRMLEPRFPGAASGGNGNSRALTDWSELSEAFDPTIDRGCWIDLGMP